MSDGSLSQEEIDALLQGADDLGATIEPETSISAGGLTEEETNELTALASEIAASMGTTLSTITGKTAGISNPNIAVVTKDVLISGTSGKLVQVVANYTEGITGYHSYIISEDAAKQVAALMMAQEEDEGELTEMALSALSEGFSQMSGASNNIIEEKSGKAVKTEGLNAEIREDPVDLETPEGDFIRIRYDFVSNGSSSNIDEIYDIEAAKEIVGEILSKKGISIQQASPQPDTSFQAGLQATTASTGLNLGGGSTAGFGNVGVQSVQFAPLSATPQPEVTGNIGLLMDVSMQLTVELGRTKMLIKDILGMGEGTIVELDKLAGEPVDLLVNGKLIAKGEVVVIDENFGVRVTDIISPMERITNLE